MNNLLSGKLTSRGNLNGNVNTIVFAHNYNDLTNKPSINNVTLQGNKTASDLGLATPSDITVTSVNDQTGDVVLSGSDIDYSVGKSLNAKIDDLESQIQGSGVQSVNGMTGNVILTGNDINYSTGVTIKNKIDAVEGEIDSVSEDVSQLSDDLSALTAEDIPMSGTDSTPVAKAIGDLSQLTTTDKSSLVGAVNEVNGKVTPQTITITPNTTVATGFDYSVVKIGKLVSYYISCQLTASITATGTVIASGLPKAVRDTQIPVTALSGANVGQTNQMAIMTDGKFQTRYTSTGTFPSGAYMLASGCYITSE